MYIDVVSFFYLGSIISFNTRETTLTGDVTEFPDGSQLSLFACGQRGKCCSFSLIENTNTDISFEGDHPCRGVVFDPKAVVEGKITMDLELKGTSSTLELGWFTVNLSGSTGMTVWFSCTGLDVEGDSGPVSFAEHCHFGIKF